MKRILTALLCFTLCAPATALAQMSSTLATPGDQPPAKAPGPSVRLSQIVIDMGHGDVWGTTGLWACVTKFPLVWGYSGGPWFDSTILEQGFRHRMEAAGVKVDVAPKSLLGRADDDTGPDIAISASVTRLWGDLCAPRIGDTKSWKGAIDMSVNWEIFSRRRGEIVGRLRTRGSAAAEHATRTSFEEMVQEAFEANLKDLINAEGFAELVAPPPPRKAADLTHATDQPVIKLLGPKPVRPLRIGDATGSVVTIVTSTGHGSAVLVSSDGYFLTDNHVVGTEKQVKVRWPDGIERPGEVVRTHKGRDVALIKADARGREPLPIRLTTVQIGDVVYAIGAPLDQALEGTVTRGIVSAHRTFSGLAYIQSDVQVTHGNSGGPLLDEHGAVIGLTDLGVAPNDVPLGLNLFTPVGDALDFLGAQAQ